jgi:murein DD-endopeptidase MepM/ murein hydrolase activator NlpD
MANNFKRPAIKHLVLLLALFLSLRGASQSVELFTENKPGNTTIFAKNMEIYPVSISLSLDITNMVFSEGDKTVFVIPAKNEKFKIGELNAEPSKRSKFSYRYRVAMGDITAKTDYNYIYELPFLKGKSYSLFQGYNGSFSHKNENALDFTMPEGSEILAARDGIIVQVVQNNTESCNKEECKKYNNYVTVMHNDGSFAQYVHIKYNGAKFKIGEAVKKGDMIAYSGNVGYSSGPHLHFVCFAAGFETRNTLETIFKIDDGSKVSKLAEGNTYKRTY